MNKNVPPAPLIRTWVWMISESKDPKMVQQGRNNLIAAFGSMKNAVAHIEKLTQTA